MEKIKKLFFLLFYYPIYWAAFFMRKKSNVWVFGAWFGNRYADNSKYFFEYCNKHTSLNCIWLSQNKDVVKQVRYLGYKSFYIHSWGGIKHQAIAQVGIVCTGKADLNPFLVSSKIKLVNLWHGTPLKKIMFDDKITFKPPKEGILSMIFPYYRPTRYELICASSSEVASKFKTAFNVYASNIVVTGYPRNDHLRPSSKSSSIRRGIYMPTHRGEGDMAFIEKLKNVFNVLDDFLTNNHISLDVKMHYYYQRHLQKNTHYDNLHFVLDDDIGGDVYTVLSNYDFLITDYSSVYFDFLCLNRPIIFFPFDIEDYLVADRELYYTYDDVTPGPKAYDVDQLQSCMLNIEGNEIEYKKFRDKIQSTFNSYNDGFNSKRVYAEIALKI